MALQSSSDEITNHTPIESGSSGMTPRRPAGSDDAYSALPGDVKELLLQLSALKTEQEAQKKSPGSGIKPQQLQALANVLKEILGNQLANSLGDELQPVQLKPLMGPLRHVKQGTDHIFLPRDEIVLLKDALTRYLGVIGIGQLKTEMESTKSRVNGF